MNDIKPAERELADFVGFVELSDELVGKQPPLHPKGSYSEQFVRHNTPVIRMKQHDATELALFV
jgi:hypothetical protein